MLGLDGGDATLTTVIWLVVVYLVLTRVLDPFEKEPLWAVGLVFGFGALAAFGVHLAAGTVTMVTAPLVGSLLSVAAVFVALAAGLLAIDAYGRSRGWSELSSALDGLIYGLAAGLGYAAGAVLVSGLLVPTPLDVRATPTSLALVALDGVAHGVAGALIGIGFGLALHVSAPPRRILLVAAGILAAVLTSATHAWLAAGGAFSGTLRAVVAYGRLIAPGVIVLAFVIGCWRWERRAIRSQLTDDDERFVAPGEDARLVGSVVGRRTATARRLLAGDLDGWVTLRSLHHRLSQLAFATARAERTTDETARRRISREIQNLRADALRLQAALRHRDRVAATGGAGRG